MIEELRMLFFDMKNCLKNKFYFITLRHLRLMAISIVLMSVSALAQAPLDIRVALVIGNSAYTSAPQLGNPQNDAKAMTIILKKLGFEVINVNDGSKDEILSGIKKMQATLKGRQAVAMLYYAGHGLQSNWHNYMVPVDINLSRSVNIPQQNVDIDIVLDAFKNSGTRMNIIVLDACRDNPFGEKSGSKGLAQIDAPLNTYIAFATAPGNVAKDGDEKLGNGLFTSYLIKELQRPAPIEDMFKRVRLQVRKASDGSQIPWDSSSLESEFAFNDGSKHTLNIAELSKELDGLKPPLVIASTIPAKEASRDDLFEMQKSEWDKIKDSKNPDDFYTYLNKYPNGSISQEATFKLNQLSKIKINAVADKNGIIQLANQKLFRVGDEYTYIGKNLITGEVYPSNTSTVIKIADGLVYSKGRNGREAIRTENGATVRGNASDATFSFDPPLAVRPSDEFQVGKKWSSESFESSKYGRYRRLDNFKVIKIEEVTVPAGTFKAFVIQNQAFVGNRGGISTTVDNVWWFVPELGVPVKRTRNTEQNVLFGGKERHEVYELVAFKKGN